MFIDVGFDESATVGVFEKAFAGAQAALLEAVNDLNTKERDMTSTLSAEVHTIPRDDSLTAAKTG